MKFEAAYMVEGKLVKKVIHAIDEGSAEEKAIKALPKVTNGKPGRYLSVFQIC